MSNKSRPHYADQKGTIQEGFDGKALVAEGSTVPTDGTAGYAPGCLFFKRGGAAGAAQYVNEGTSTSCAFKAVAAGGDLVTTGVAAGYKIARGQHTTVAASDTVVTGLTTVVAVVAQLDSDPVDGAMHVTSSIGDQAGTPAAGSVLIKSWKSTDGDATLVAGTTFSLKVNWIAIGT